MIMEKTCGICGQAFRAVRKNARYCSDPCRKRAKHRSNRRRERAKYLSDHHALPTVRKYDRDDPHLKHLKWEQRTFREKLLQNLAERDQKYELIKLKTNIRICGRARIETRGQCFYAKKWK